MVTHACLVKLVPDPFRGRRMKHCAWIVLQDTTRKVERFVQHVLRTRTALFPQPACHARIVQLALILMEMMVRMMSVIATIVVLAGMRIGVMIARIAHRTRMDHQLELHHARIAQLELTRMEITVRMMSVIASTALVGTLMLVDIAPIAQKELTQL